MIFVKPAHGLRVRHPEKIDQILPKEGTWVQESTALKRLIKDGDLEVDKTKAPEEAPTSEKHQTKRGK